ncbi:MAG: pectate lyase, partial [Catenulispora sp.]
YTSQSLIENNIVIHYNKIDVMRSAGGGNVFGYNYADDGADSGGGWFETNLNSSHMTTPHYELFEGNEAANFDQDDRWGNSAYVTVFRNHLIGQLRDFPSSGPQRAAGLTQWHWWQSFVGNVLGNAAHPGLSGYEGLGSNQTWGGSMWMICWQNNDSTGDGGKCLSTQLRDGNFDYATGKVHWHGIGGSGAGNGLTPPANATLPASMYLPAKPAFFGTRTWPWADGSNPANPLPGQLPARVRYDAGTPNATS